MVYVIVLVVLASGAILYACVIGIAALRRSWLGGEHVRALRLLALNLCEPLINTPLVFGLLGFVDHPLSGGNVAGRLLCTLPMMVLLVPIWGVFSRATRGISWTLVLLGSARWILTVITLTSRFTEAKGPDDARLLWLCISISIIVLVVTTRWGQRELKQLS